MVEFHSKNLCWLLNYCSVKCWIWTMNRRRIRRGTCVCRNQKSKRTCNRYRHTYHEDIHQDVTYNRSKCPHCIEDWIGEGSQPSVRQLSLSFYSSWKCSKNTHKIWISESVDPESCPCSSKVLYYRQRRMPTKQNKATRFILVKMFITNSENNQYRSCNKRTSPMPSEYKVSSKFCCWGRTTVHVKQWERKTLSWMWKSRRQTCR